MRAKVLTEEEIPYTIKYTLGRTKSERITALITSLVENSVEAVCMDEKTKKAFDEFHHFMYESVYWNPVVKSEEKKAEALIKKLYEYFVKEPKKLPGEYQYILEESGAECAARDYISGMSDRYAVNMFESLFVPKSWKHTGGPF